MSDIAEKFWRDGFVVVPQLASAAQVADILRVTREQIPIAVHAAPSLATDEALNWVEFEADVGYPGAPRSRLEQGGKTVRRLRGAYQRDPVLADWATAPQLTRLCRDILCGDALWLTQAHHNCVMTKHPQYSSHTHWHQDIRYWGFNSPDLVNAWLALVQETQDNGALQFIPGSHRVDIQPEQFDADRFLLVEHPANFALLGKAVTVELQPGDVVLFHAKTLHAAGANLTEQTKYSLVFTYHNETVKPIPGSRSDHPKEIQL